ncbi:alpha/beta fold hydrolase [Haladaptatus halobius]|uniref:alpha/beta fold hydrolase n=1 Tax=Haladaptatus halobius TaxID=2884875 RepID=UPI001D0BA295|nr:alpha/beta hydrolase [Haladaptatus halobius]
MPRATVRDGVELFYEDLGEGPTVVLIHGGLMSHRVWEMQVTALLDSGHRVVAPDLRGHGCSAKPVSPYTAEMHAADLEALRTTLGVDEWGFVGWSLGATVATAYVATHPERLTHLALVSTGIFAGMAPSVDDGSDDNGLDVEVLLDQQRIGRPAGVAAYVDRMFGGNPDEWTKEWLWGIAMETPLRVALKTLDIYRDPDYDAMARTLSSLLVPGAVFHGARDGAAPLSAAERVADEVFADGRFVPFEASGHVPFLTESVRFNERLLAFLEE